MKRIRALVLAALACVGNAQAASFRATVTHVSDGDTVWVRPARGGPAIAIRIVGVDAPESCQDFGPQATRALAARVLHRVVQVHTRGVDDYRRRLARIALGRDDIGAWLVRDGYAWSMTFRGRAGPYARLESQARQAHRGLWAAGDPLPPRDFRRRFGPCR